MNIRKKDDFAVIADGQVVFTSERLKAALRFKQEFGGVLCMVVSQDSSKTNRSEKGGAT